MKTIHYGRWTQSEKHIYENNFNKLINKQISYKELSNLIRTRSPIQIRSHHQKIKNKLELYAKILLSLKNKK